MPIDINNLRPERGGDPAKWRDMVVRRFKSGELVDNVIALDQVSEAAASAQATQHAAVDSAEWLVRSKLSFVATPRGVRYVLMLDPGCVP
jgi:hypothetical protein